MEKEWMCEFTKDVARAMPEDGGFSISFFKSVTSCVWLCDEVEVNVFSAKTSSAVVELLQPDPPTIKNAANTPKTPHLKICFRIMRTPFSKIHPVE